MSNYNRKKINRKIFPNTSYKNILQMFQHLNFAKAREKIMRIKTRPQKKNIALCNVPNLAMTINCKHIYGRRKKKHLQQTSLLYPNPPPQLGVLQTPKKKQPIFFYIYDYQQIQNGLKCTILRKPKFCNEITNNYLYVSEYSFFYYCLVTKARESGGDERWDNHIVL